MSHYRCGVRRPGYAKDGRGNWRWNICANGRPGTVATDLTINSMGWDVIHEFKMVPMGRLADKRRLPMPSRGLHRRKAIS